MPSLAFRRAAPALLASLSLGLMACAPATQPQASASQPTAPAPAPVVAPATPTFVPVQPLGAARVTTFTSAAQVTDPARTYRAVLNTSKGPITLELYAKQAPVAVNNFVFLALNRFYDGTRFHRVIEGFMAQGGDPQSTDPALRARWGTGGPGYSFRAEVGNGLRFDRAGVLGMARAASLDSQGSQFFITLAPADFLSGGYTVFGQVVSGLDTLQRLTRTATPNGEVPIPGAQPDLIQSVQILVSR
ncbi:peptidylprolyl isomerase [Deinococcus sp. HSC-46F16]|uniref:peptidylprolyl isomerase n=1 Tax=Deinococcus sp. HSC-46F16 TaxID=2910968 RepID=UPI00209EAF26|nr:peptidylprolyl isomerase [Deinococcus sp. HSC-46F16]MCP2013762.1 peptidylprolyl isomerase [Deinococcus sp. HSC-46F16]